MLIPEDSVSATGAMEDGAPLERTLRRDVALLSEGFRSSAATSRWSDVRVVLSDGACDAHRLVLASASCLLGAALSELEALQEDVSTVIMPDFDTESFSRLAAYLYGGLEAEADDYREDGLLECLRIGDFQSIRTSRSSKEGFHSILEPIVSVKQEPRVWREDPSRNPSQDYQEEQQQYWGRGEQWEDEDYSPSPPPVKKKRRKRKKRIPKGEDEEDEEGERDSKAKVPKVKIKKEDTNEDGEGARLNFDCGGCGLVFPGVPLLLSHLEVCPKEGAKLTSICDEEKCETSRVFHSYAKFRVHQMAHQNKFKCELCAKTFDERGKYIKHCENVHKKGLGEKNYKCHICEKAFEYSKNLNTHISMQHAGQGDVPPLNHGLKCSQCEATFKTKGALHYHRQQHADKFQCVLPGKCSSSVICLVVIFRDL